MPTPETEPKHWITLVRERATVGWETPDPPDPFPRPPPIHCGGQAKVDDGSPIVLPEPQKCPWCGYLVRAEIVERWEARTFGEVFEPGTMQPWHKKYKTPLKMYVFGYPCICLTKPPYTHWIVAVRLKKSPGWDLDGVNT